MNQTFQHYSCCTTTDGHSFHDEIKLATNPSNVKYDYARQTHENYQVLPYQLYYSVDFKAPREFWNPLGKIVPYLVNAALFGIKDP